MFKGIITGTITAITASTAIAAARFFWKKYKASKKERKSKLPKEVNQKDIDMVNTYFQGKVKIFCQAFQCPIVTIAGDWPLNPQQTLEAKKEGKRLEQCDRPNDLHAILIEEPNWKSNPVHMQARRIDFAGLTVLRNEKKRPKIITSNVLIICSETKEVLLHRRSEKSATNPGKLQIFGGGHMPGHDLYHGKRSRSSDSSLQETAQRELEEETTIKSLIPDSATMILALDNSHPDKPSLQLAYLACDIPKKALEIAINTFNDKKNSKAEDNYSWEGHLEKYRFKDFLNLIENDDPENSEFSPSGKAHILIWLALGCPGLHQWKGEAGAQNARQVFDRVMDKTVGRRHIVDALTDTASA